MLRKIAAGTSAAVVAAGLAAVAAGLSASSGAALPGRDPRTPQCSDAAPSEQSTFGRPIAHGFVFGPLAEVPHRQSQGPSCGTVNSVVTDFSGAHRSASPPPVGTPVPEAPSSPPPDISGPETPGPGESPPPAPSGPPADTSSPPSPPVVTPTPAPAPVAPSPPPALRAPTGGPGENVLPQSQPPTRAPARLPQTAGDTRPLTVAGGGSLIAAGLAWIGGASRRRKRPVDPAVGD